MIDNFSSSDIHSTIRRLAVAEKSMSHMGDTTSDNNDTPSFLGTISKSRRANGRNVEERATLDTGCMLTVVPMSMVQDHNLLVFKPDADEPGMRG